MKQIKNMTVGKSYKCIRQVGSGEETSFVKGKIYPCTDCTPYIFVLQDEQGNRHPWASQLGRKLYAHINSGWADNWADFFIELT